MHNSSKLICISGSSGVGKTTVANILQKMLGDKHTLVLSGDDLHKYERNDDIWNAKTHLDPECNDLDLGFVHLKDLMSGRAIARRFYSHDTGKFDDAVIVRPADNIVFEGLHALYHEGTNSLADIKIFVETEENLKFEWKMKRDTKKRGYTKDQVLDIINRRKNDEIKYIEPQKRIADIHIRFSCEDSNDIEMNVSCISKEHESFANSLKNFYEDIKEFLWICKKITLDPSLVQERGGNVSTKSKIGMIITSSGGALSRVSLQTGFCVLKNFKMRKFLSDEDYTHFLMSFKNADGKIPSMETGLHHLFNKKHVIHAHPFHLNVLLCCQESNEILRNVFHDLDFEVLNYVSPGYQLANQARIGDKDICFLQNHGVVVADDDAKVAFKTLEMLDTRAKKWIEEKCIKLVTISEDAHTAHLFPDSVIFPQLMRNTNEGIRDMILMAGLTPKYLTSEQTNEIVNMQLEKMRSEAL